MSALFSASAASMDTVLQHAALYGLAAFLFGYLGKKLIDLWIDSMRRQSTMDQHAHDAQRLARSGRTHTWPNMVVPGEQPQEAPTLKVVPFKPVPPFPYQVEPDGALTVTAGVLNPGFGNPYPADHPAGLPESTGGDPGRSDLTGVPPETPAETSGRHALTESMPAVVDDERAFAAMANVPSEDGFL